MHVFDHLSCLHVSSGSYFERLASLPLQLLVFHHHQVTHVVCGHRGTVGFASPAYTVSEGNGFLMVTIVRSGGGYGAFEIAYSLEHEGTDDADVTSTAPYTTSQVIPFPEGAVAMTFKVTIHDDRV